MAFGRSWKNLEEKISENLKGLDETVSEAWWALRRLPGRAGRFISLL